MNKSGVNLSLAGRVALITGGSRGIGAATVKAFVSAGAKVVFNYHQSQADAEQVVSECGGERCVAVQSDLNAMQNAADLVSATVRHFGRLDILVANHGIWVAEPAPIERMSDNQWRRTLAINLDSVFALVKASITEMKKTGAAAPCRRSHRVGRFHLRAAGRSLPLRLRGQQRRAHQHREKPCHRACGQRHLRELCRPGVGGHGIVRSGAAGCSNPARNPSLYPAGTSSQARRDRGANFVSVH